MKPSHFQLAYKYIYGSKDHMYRRGVYVAYLTYQFFLALFGCGYATLILLQKSLIFQYLTTSCHFIIKSLFLCFLHFDFCMKNRVMQCHV